MKLVYWEIIIACDSLHIPYFSEGSFITGLNEAVGANELEIEF